MTNPFANIITQEFKDLHKNMIDGLLDDAGCTVPCTISYGGSKFVDCPNCEYNVLTGKSANIYTAGGPIVFTTGQCPFCSGRGKTITTSTAIVYLAPIWDVRDWIQLSGNSNIANTSDTLVQTLSKINTYDELKRATSVVIDNNIQGYGTQEFMREGNPEPCGLGQSTIVVTMWKKTA